jgi:hypothetical protein
MDFEVANYMLSKENLEHDLPIQNVSAALWFLQ